MWWCGWWCRWWCRCWRWLGAPGMLLCQRHIRCFKLLFKNSNTLWCGLWYHFGVSFSASFLDLLPFGVFVRGDANTIGIWLRIPSKLVLANWFYSTQWWWMDETVPIMVTLLRQQHRKQLSGNSSFWQDYRWQSSKCQPPDRARQGILQNWTFALLYTDDITIAPTNLYSYTCNTIYVYTSKQKKTKRSNKRIIQKYKIIVLKHSF